MKHAKSEDLRALLNMVSYQITLYNDQLYSYQKFYFEVYYCISVSLISDFFCHRKEVSKRSFISTQGCQQVQNILTKMKINFFVDNLGANKADISLTFFNEFKYYISTFGGRGSEQKC